MFKSLAVNRVCGSTSLSERSHSSIFKSSLLSKPFPTPNPIFCKSWDGVTPAQRVWKWWGALCETESKSPLVSLYSKQHKEICLCSNTHTQCCVQEVLGGRPVTERSQVQPPQQWTRPSVAVCPVRVENTEPPPAAAFWINMEINCWNMWNNSHYWCFSHF